MATRTHGPTRLNPSGSYPWNSDVPNLSSRCKDATQERLPAAGCLCGRRGIVTYPCTRCGHLRCERCGARHQDCKR